MMRFFILFVTVLAMARDGFMSIGNHSVGAFSDLEFPNDRENRTDGAWLEEIGEHRQLVRREAAKQMHSIGVWTNSVQLRTVCDCRSRYDFIDLGPHHYPRYIAMVKCEAKSCANQFYKCKHLLYRSSVLVKRGVNSTLKNPDEHNMRDVKEVRLPDSLQGDWELLIVRIPVACIAKKDNRLFRLIEPL